jgi:hypothetical protein
MLNPPLTSELAEVPDDGQIAPTPSISWSESLLAERKTSEKKGVHPGMVARPLSSVASTSAVPLPMDPETEPSYTKQVQLPLGQIEESSHAPDVVLVRVADIVPENDLASAVAPSRRMTAATIVVATQDSFSIRASPSTS